MRPWPIKWYYHGIVWKRKSTKTSTGTAGFSAENRKEYFLNTKENRTIT